jgi:DNA polymerase I-like protein with 3'-5' exonuclease and polymerase domains
MIKEAIIRYDSIRKEGRLLVSVHDEVNVSAPKRALKAELLLLREAMESLGTGGSNRWGTDKRYDLPMLSDAKMGPRWGELTKVEEQR